MIVEKNHVSFESKLASIYWTLYGYGFKPLLPSLTRVPNQAYKTLYSYGFKLTKTFWQMKPTPVLLDPCIST